MLPSKNRLLRASQPVLPFLSHSKQNKSHSSTGNPKLESRTTAVKQSMKTQQGLASLEKKVDRLLKVRIRLLMIKDKSQEVRELVARIDAQLDSIRKKVLKVSREGGAGGTGIRHSLVQNGGKSDQNVSSVLEAKIKLIERLISHNVTDSEILKGFYQVFTHTTQYEKLGEKSNIKGLVFDKKTCKFQRDRQLRVYPHDVVTFETTKQRDYLIPKQEYYNWTRVSEQDDQNASRAHPEPSPVPRSTYQQEFPGHIATKVYKHVRADESVKTVEGFYGGGMTSYMKSFNQSRNEVKQDHPSPFKDNIRNLDIVFRAPGDRVEDRKMALMERQWCRKPLDKALTISGFHGQFASTNGKEFKHHKVDEVSRSQPKNSRLRGIIDENRSLLCPI